MSNELDSQPPGSCTGDSTLIKCNAPDQQTLLTMAHERPDKTLLEARRLQLPSRHEVRAADIDLKRLGAVLAVAYEQNLHDFASLLLTKNLGPRTLQSMALIAEVVHGAPTRFSDPARFSFAHGGKDGHPFPVPLKTYDESISVLQHALDQAKLGDRDKVDGLRRLDGFVRNVERRFSPHAEFNDVLRHEHKISKDLGGKSVVSTSSLWEEVAPD